MFITYYSRLKTLTFCHEDDMQWHSSISLRPLILNISIYHVFQNISFWVVHLRLYISLLLMVTFVYVVCPVFLHDPTVLAFVLLSSSCFLLVLRLYLSSVLTLLHVNFRIFRSHLLILNLFRSLQHPCFTWISECWPHHCLRFCTDILTSDMLVCRKSLLLILADFHLFTGYMFQDWKLELVDSVLPFF